MTIHNKATIGTISHGTMRRVDLLGSFEYELRRICGDNAEHLKLANEARDREQVLLSQPELEEDEDRELVDELFDALDSYAPPYCYFGAIEGDGSDYGFWPSMDSIDELPRVADPADVAAMGEDCCFVNDHGNVTVYDASGAVVLELV